MIMAFIILFVLTYSPAAVWAIRAGGLRRLWLLSALALLAVVLLALVTASYTSLRAGA